MQYHSIFVRVRMHNKYKDLYVNYSTTLQNWDDKKHQVKQNTKNNGIPAAIINRAIQSTIEFVEKYYDDCRLRECIPSLDELSKNYQHCSGENSKHEYDFFKIYAGYVEEMRIQRQWTTSTYETEKRTMRKLQEYNKDITFSSLTTNFINGFIEQQLKVMRNDKLKDYIKKLKAFGKWAVSKKYPMCEDLLNYDMSNFHGTEKQVQFLQWSEVQALWNLDLSDDRRLEEARDIFIFQCLTSLRYSDIKALKTEDLQQENGVYSISLFTQKNKKRIESFPLASIAQKILQKYLVNQYPNHVVFPVPANPQYNRYLKDVGVRANLKGTWQDYHFEGNKRVVTTRDKTELTSHVARRTFISLALNSGVSSDIVALVTSHSSIQEMKPYLNITSEGKKKLSEIFENL